jgi:hypothetical protein
MAGLTTAYRMSVQHLLAALPDFECDMYHVIHGFVNLKYLGRDHGSYFEIRLAYAGYLLGGMWNWKWGAAMAGSRRPYAIMDIMRRLSGPCTTREIITAMGGIRCILTQRRLI